MDPDSKKFLYDLLSTPSLTGNEGEIQKLIKDRMTPFADYLESDSFGNLIVGLNVTAPLRILLDAHCDQIGFMVKHISNDGYIFVDRLGGIDRGIVAGAKVVIQSESGPISGVFGRKPIHKQTAEERQKMTLDIERNWIDIGAKSKKEVEEIIKIGDCAHYFLEVTELQNGLIASPGLDDKAGIFVVMEALRLCAKEKIKVALFAISSTQEEIGQRGAKASSYSVNPQIGIGVDVTFATDNPGRSDDDKVPEVKLNSGPVIVHGPNINKIVFKQLAEVAKSSKIPHQIKAESSPLGNNTNTIQISRDGVAAACIQIPNRHMHTPVEICDLEDLNNSAKLLAKFIQSLNSKFDPTPY